MQISQSDAIDFAVRFCSIHSIADEKCFMGYSRYNTASIRNAGLRFRRAQLFASLVALSCYVIADNFAEAAAVTLDQNITIDASNSFPEPMAGNEPLTIEI